VSGRRRPWGELEVVVQRCGGLVARNQWFGYKPIVGVVGGVCSGAPGSLGCVSWWGGGTRGCLGYLVSGGEKGGSVWGKICRKVRLWVLRSGVFVFFWGMAVDVLGRWSKVQLCKTGFGCAGEGGGDAKS